MKQTVMKHVISEPRSDRVCIRSPTAMCKLATRVRRTRTCARHAARTRERTNASCLRFSTPRSTTTTSTSTGERSSPPRRKPHGPCVSGISSLRFESCFTARAKDGCFPTPRAGVPVASISRFTRDERDGDIRLGVVKRLAPEIGVRIDRDAPIRRFPRAHPDRFRATHTDPCFHTEKFSQLTARPPASSVSPRVTGTSSSLPTSPSSYPRVAFSPRYVSDPRTEVEVPHARRFPAGVRRRDSTIALSVCAAESNVWMRAVVFQSLPAQAFPPPACAVTIPTRPIPDDLIPPSPTRPSGAVSACSSPAAGCTTPSTGPNRTSCCTGACPVPTTRGGFAS